MKEVIINIHIATADEKDNFRIHIKYFISNKSYPFWFMVVSGSLIFSF